MGNAANRRERRRHERREAILEAAATVFGQKGAHAATMDEVAEAADVSKGTVYLYFPSKDELFLALAHRPLDAVLARFEELTGDDVDGLTLLQRLVDAHQETTHAHAAQMRVAFASMCAGFDPAPEWSSLRDYGERIQRLRRTYLDAIHRGIEDGSIRPDIDPDEVGAALWAGMFGASFIRMNADRFQLRVGDDPPPYALDRIHEAVSKLLFRAIAARIPEVA